MNYGKEAYEAYCRHTNWKSLATGATLPQWDVLPEAIQTAWHVTAAWLLGLFTANGVHEHRLNARIRELGMKLAGLEKYAGEPKPAEYCIGYLTRQP